MFEKKNNTLSQDTELKLPDNGRQQYLYMICPTCERSLTELGDSGGSTNEERAHGIKCMCQTWARVKLVARSMTDHGTGKEAHDYCDGSKPS